MLTNIIRSRPSSLYEPNGRNALSLTLLPRNLDRLFDILIHHHPHILHLLRNTLQHPSDLFISLHKPELRVLKSLLLGKLFHQMRGCFEVVSRKTREEMMRNLKVQATVDERKGVWADDVDSCAQLAVHEGFEGAKVSSGAGEMGENNL